MCHILFSLRKKKSCKRNFDLHRERGKEKKHLQCYKSIMAREVTCCKLFSVGVPP